MDANYWNRPVIFEELAWREPLAVFAELDGEPDAHLLHGGSAAPDGWSILVRRPTKRLEWRDGKASVDGVAVASGPFEALRQMLRDRSSSSSCAPAGAPFASGLVGYVGYEVGAALEPSAKGPKSPFAMPDMAFGAYDGALLFHEAEERVFLSARHNECAARLKEVYDRAGSGRVAPTHARHLSANFAMQDYRNAVNDVIERILKGDIFQANIAQHIRAELMAFSNAGFFAALVKMSAAPFAACLQYGNSAIISNSPERFFRLAHAGVQRRVTCEPIKGTRPRSADPRQDRALAESLIVDEKDRAENIMIADLIRNDLSRICLDASIREDALCALESYATVHHMVSRISGVVQSGLDVADVFEALFPCGSVTGAPKIEAMKTIAHIEPCGRGPYTGAIGYIDDDGRADFSVAIRTLIVESCGDGSRASFPVGGGVTALSDCHAEYEETLVKASTFLSAVGSEEWRPR